VVIDEKTYAQLLDHLAFQAANYRAEIEADEEGEGDRNPAREQRAKLLELSQTTINRWVKMPPPPQAFSPRRSCGRNLAELQTPRFCNPRGCLPRTNRRRDPARSAK